MKKRMIALGVLVALLLCGCQKTDPAQQLDEKGQPLQGFVTQMGKTNYYIDGYLQSGWITLDGKRYYLDSDGISQGWKTVDQDRYYFDRDGAMQTGWLELDGRYYFLNEDGAMHTGWLGEGENRCYLGQDGALVSGILTLEEGSYLLDDQGIPLTGWQEMDGQRYYLEDSGLMHTGWLDYEGDRYYFLKNGPMAVGEVELEERSWFFTSTGKNVLIVNFRSPIPEDHAPELVTWRGITLEKQTMDAVKAMILDGEAMGHKFWLNSAYRTVADQERIWNNRYDKYISEGLTHDQAVEKVSMSVAKPGTSEHHTGLAVDIDGTLASLDWMAENSWKYGLIVRFPEGKTEYTGVIYEPWHFRYVGVELAQELYELDLCMEEYMEMLTQQQVR